MVYVFDFAGWWGNVAVICGGDCGGARGYNSYPGVNIMS